MSERSKDFMSKIWERRNSDADTEEKLVSAILQIVAEEVKFYEAFAIQNNQEEKVYFLDKKDLLSLADELVQ